MLRLKRYIMIAITGSVIFGCGARVANVDLEPKTTIANLEKGKTCIKI